MKNIEKYVKSSLKKKITVNRALIILFMITGSFSMSEQEDNIIKSNALGKNSSAKNGYVFGDNSTVVSKDGKDVEKIKEIFENLKKLNGEKKESGPEDPNMKGTSIESSVSGFEYDGELRSARVRTRRSVDANPSESTPKAMTPIINENVLQGNRNKVFGNGNLVFGSENKVGTETKDVMNNILFGNKIDATNVNNAIVFGNESKPVEGAVSFGNDKTTRQLKFVAEGKNGTDAVNFSQLKDYVKKNAKGKNVNIKNELISKLNYDPDTYLKIDETYLQYISGKKENPKILAPKKLSLNIDGVKDALGKDSDIANPKDKFVTDQKVHDYVTTNFVSKNDLDVTKFLKSSDLDVKGDNTYIKVDNNQNGKKNNYKISLKTDEIKKYITSSVDLSSKADKNADNITVSEWAKKLGTGTVTTGDKGLVTGGTVFNAINPIKTQVNTLETNLNGKLSDITINGDTYINTKKDGKGAYTLTFNADKLDLSNNTTLKGKADKDANNLESADVTKWQEKLGTGTVATGDKGLVTGGTVFNAINPIKTQVNTLETNLNGKLSDISITGDTYITATKDENKKGVYTLKFNTDKLDLSNNTTLKGKADKDANNLESADVTKWQEKLGTGTVATGDKGLVTGGTVFTYVDNIKQQLSTKATEDLAKKLDIDAKNITDDGVATLTTKLGTGEIKDNNNNLVTGGTVKKYITEEINNINTKVSGKLSSEDVDVKGDEYITVNKDVQKPNHYSLVFDKDKLASNLDLSKNTKLTEQFNKYALLDGSNLDSIDLNIWQSKLGNGEIKDNNNGLVKGSTVYNYVNTIKQELTNQSTQDLSNKLDKDGSNLDKPTLDKLTNKLSEGSNLTTPTNRLVTDTTVSEALKGKLNVDADNLTTKGETNLINKLSKGSDISKPNNRLVTDTQVNEHLKNNYYNKADVDAKVSNISNTVVETNKKSELALGGVANAVAMANLVQVNSYSKHRHNLSAAYGYYGGAHALAVGFSGTNEERNFVYKLSGSVNNKGNLAFGVGAGVMLGEENDYIESTEVKKLKETVKEQKDKISNLEKKLDEVLKLIKK